MEFEYGIFTKWDAGFDKLVEAIDFHVSWKYSYLELVVAGDRISRWVLIFVNQKFKVYPYYYIMEFNVYKQYRGIINRELVSCKFVFDEQPIRKRFTLEILPHPVKTADPEYVEVSNFINTVGPLLKEVADNLLLDFD